MENIMKLGIEEAQKTMRKDIGGPFGAVITAPDGSVVAVASNTVLGDCDPTATLQAAPFLQPDILVQCV